jgi:hypothetical protein
MRATLIVHAHPATFALLAKHGRFAGVRQTLGQRLFAAFLVFTGRADALLWERE